LQRDAAQAIARVLVGAGHQAWIVGGAVRDLAVGTTPHEVDLATDALPDRIEELFERTMAVGKAFGTIVVHQGTGANKVDIEVTTFRSDGRYADGRRPEQVTFGTSVEEDARRRDFTCNALYLDPLTDDFQDPEQGLADLRAGRLRCVGEPAARFAEDGLRLLRMARFSARLGLTPTEEVLDAARSEAETLRGVSRERVLSELEGMLTTPRPAMAFSLLAAADLLERTLPPSRTPGPERGLWQEQQSARLAALESLGGPIPLATGLTVLLDPAPLGSGEHRRDQALGWLEDLRTSRALRHRVAGAWRLMDALRRSLSEPPPRSTRLRMMRDESWPTAVDALAAWLSVLAPERSTGLEQLSLERATLTEEELSPAPLLTSADLFEAGVERGPRWGELLLEAETLQLDGELADRAAALAWLAAQAGR
jgi:tRNA nucleotidyltransferase/poly(A) polymerase